MPIIENSVHLRLCADCGKPIFYAAGCFFDKKTRLIICLACYKQKKSTK